MASELLKMAYREREILQAELAKNATWQKLQQVLKLIDTYVTFEEKEPEAAVEQPVPAPNNPRRPTQLDVVLGQHKTKVAQVNFVVSEHFCKTGLRASSGELLPIVQARGIQLGGAIPSKTLASFLTNSELFNNVKGLGYGLVEWGEGPGPNAPEQPLTFQQAADTPLGGVVTSYMESKNNSGAGDDRS